MLTSVIDNYGIGNRMQLSMTMHIPGSWLATCNSSLDGSFTWLSLVNIRRKLNKANGPMASAISFGSNVTGRGGSGSSPTLDPDS